MKRSSDPRHLLPDLSRFRLSPEMRVLIWSARRYQRPAEDRIVLPDALDWDALLASSIHHGVPCMLFEVLAAAEHDAAPPEVLEWLADWHEINAIQNLRLAGELFALLEAFEAVGIPALVLKGLPLTARYYGGLAGRKNGDLDLLIPGADVVRAVEMLRERGFAPTGSAERDPRRLRSDPTCYHYPMIRAAGRPEMTMVELHWTLFPQEATGHLSFRGAALQPDVVWRQSLAVPLLGRTCRTLSPEDHLLFLCAHGLKHTWEKLYLVQDLDVLVRNEPALDWERFWDRARLVEGLHVAEVGLTLARCVLQTPLPEPLSSQVETLRGAYGMRTVLGGWDVRPGRRWGDDGFSVARWWTRQLAVGNWALRARKDRVAMIAEFLRRLVRPNRQDRAFLALPHAIAFLYPLVRLVRLSYRVSSAAWKAKSYPHTG